MPTLTPIPFHHQTVQLIEHEGKPYVAMRPIVENLGLDWKAQHRKLTDKFAKGVVTMTTPSAGGPQQTLCLPLTKLAAFLYSIDANRVKPELRDLVIAYQDECDEVLYRHFAAKHMAEHNAYTALLDGVFARHPKWRGVLADKAAGCTLPQIAARHGMNRRNAQRMLQRIRLAGIPAANQAA